MIKTALNIYLYFISTNFPTFSLPYSCLRKVCVVVQNEGHSFQSVKHNLKKISWINF